MAETVWYESLRLTDASKIRQQGIAMNDARSVAAIRDEIRGLLGLCGHQAWTAGLTDPQDPIKAVIGLETIDTRARRALMHLYSGEEGLLPALVKGIVQKAFWDIGLYRIEVALPANNENDVRVLRQIGFNEEGRLRGSILDPVTNRRQDILVLSLLRPEFMEYGTAFIPFRLGVFAVTGHGQGLTEAGFIRYGDRMPNEFQHECAEMAGILDEHGHLAARDYFADYQESHSSIVHANAPEPVLEAASQVQAYFTGTLKRFDLPLDLSEGSDFQTRVWEALAGIPFGTTWTYEELAYRLTPDDWAAARRMARAIGSACGANPLPLILPCHRVIGKDGRLVGFSGGLDIKEFLLDYEMMGCSS